LSFLVPFLEEIALAGEARTCCIILGMHETTPGGAGTLTYSTSASCLSISFRRFSHRWRLASSPCFNLVSPSSPSFPLSPFQLHNPSLCSMFGRWLLTSISYLHDHPVFFFLLPIRFCLKKHSCNVMRS
jgi:hypothetical protein